jgi:hypothetical protein
LPRRSSVSTIFPRKGAGSPPYRRHSRANREIEIRATVIGDSVVGFRRRICVEGENASRDYAQNPATAEASRPLLLNTSNHSGDLNHGESVTIFCLPQFFLSQIYEYPSIVAIGEAPTGNF